MLSCAQAEGEGEVSWYALYTRARHEKRVDALLRERGIDSYLPLVPRVRQWHDRKKVVEFPLFPSYVFVGSQRQALSRVLSTPSIVSVVRFNGRPVPVPDEEIENVRRFTEALARAGLDGPEPAPFVAVGPRVRVGSGPCEGGAGVVVERRGGDRALLQVGIRTIRQGIKVELEARSLELLGDA